MTRLLILGLILMVGFPAAFAHPFTDQTVPAQFSNVPVGISEVVVTYSEAVEINHSTLEVFDSNGRQVDNGDTEYHEGDYSLVVTTAPLPEGVYTVTSKVLSRVDGHLVPSAFVFGVGDVEIDPPAGENRAIDELIFFPEAGARFPGLVGQTIVLGAAIASMFVWGTQRRDLVRDGLGRLEEALHGRFMSLAGLGLAIVFASNVIMLAIQTIRLEASALDVLQTSFGTTWIIRMAATVALLGVWFWMERSGRLSFRRQIPLLALSLVLIGTTTMMGHGMASGQPPAVVLDYIHNLVSAVWIGGVIFFAWVLLPSFGILDDNTREKMSLAAIPRFSIAITVAIGVVIISGPALMWMLESNAGVIAQSTYGRLIIAKILLAGAMIGIGGYHQFGIQRRAEAGAGSVSRRLRRSLRAEAVVGIALLGVVALLTNATLPEGEIRPVQGMEATYGLSTLEFADETMFAVEIFPFTSGTNTISVAVTDFAGDALPDLDALKVKVSNPQRNISPIVIPVEPAGDEPATVFEGDVTFGFSGEWQVELEAQRTESANDGKILDLLVKPRLGDLQADITEYDFPVAASPLYPESDGRGNIWVTDASEPRLWRFSIADEAFTEYWFDGRASITLKVGSDGRVWFTDIPSGRIGYVDPATGGSEIIELPKIDPAAEKNYAMTLDEDDDGRIWASVANKNVLVRYDQDAGEFDVYGLPTEDSGPFAVAAGPSGRIWFSQTVGQIGYVDPGTGEIREFVPDPPLATPETITIDSDGSLWIAEHQLGGGIARYDPLLDSFERIGAPDGEAFPNGAVFDRYQNVWFALHTVDKLAAYDPHRGEMIEVPIPSAQSWVQFTTSDENGDVWFVEQNTAKLGVLRLSEAPGLGGSGQQAGTGPRYAEIASPLMALGIIAASLFFVKSVGDKRRINALVYGQSAATAASRESRQP